MSVVAGVKIERNSSESPKEYLRNAELFVAHFKDEYDFKKDFYSSI
jgi:hypothetical protein